MKKIVYQMGRFMPFFLIISLFFIIGITYAQLEDLEELEIGTEEVKCKPDSFITIYDNFKSDSLEPQQLGIWYSLAREEYKYKNYERAIPYYWKILVNDKTERFKVVYSKLADCYYNLNQPDSVLLICYRGLEAYPDNTRLHYWGGFVHDVLNHAECAIPHYEALTIASPEEKSYWVKLAYLYYKVEDSKAIEAQQKVVDLDSDDVEASRLLAEIMEHFGEDPLLAREQTYLKDTTNVENAMRFAKAAYDRGFYQKAIKAYKTVLKQEPKNTSALEFIGRSHEGLEHLSKSLKYYKDFLQIDPKNANVMCLIASVYSRLNNFTTARSYVYKAQRIDRGSGLPHMIMAEVYENAAEYCTKKRKENKYSYDDKLLFLYAQEELKKARKDPNYASDAKRRITQLEALVPTKEDLFMHKNRKETKDKCYNWIK